MELFKTEPNINFIVTNKKLNIYKRLILLFTLSLFILINGLNLSMEYTGGTKIELSFSNEINVTKLSKLLNTKEKTIIKITQHTNKNVIIKIPKNINEKEILQKVNNLYKLNNTITLHKIDYIGAETSTNLILNSIYTTLITLSLVSLYIMLRFSFTLALGSVLALLQNVIIVLSFFSITGTEFSLATLSAIITILGYTLNNIVVIFDSIRKNETLHKNEKKLTIVNRALNKTLTRTILTTTLTLLTMLMLLIFGGDTLFSFSTALVIGIITGLHSAIYVSCCFYILDKNM